MEYLVGRMSELTPFPQQDLRAPTRIRSSTFGLLSLNHKVSSAGVWRGGAMSMRRRNRRSGAGCSSSGVASRLTDPWARRS